MAIFDGYDIFNEHRSKGSAVVRNELGGQYPLWIDLYGFPETTDLALAQHAARLLNVELLVSDNTLNPHRWLHVTQRGVRAVFANENYDDIGFYLERFDEV